MKNKKELETLKKEYENLCKKINELSQEELKEVTGGVVIVPRIGVGEEFILDRANYNAQNGRSMPRIAGNDMGVAINIKPNCHNDFPEFED